MKIPKTNINIDTEKLKNMAKNASSTIKEKAEEFGQKAQQTFEEGSQIYMRVFEKSKLEKLENERVELQKTILTKDAFLHILQMNEQQNAQQISKTSRDLFLAEQKLAFVKEKYQKFAAKQDAAQKAFEALNGINK